MHRFEFQGNSVPGVPPGCPADRSVQGLSPALFPRLILFLYVLLFLLGESGLRHSSEGRWASPGHRDGAQGGPWVSPTRRPVRVRERRGLRLRVVGGRAPADPTRVVASSEEDGPRGPSGPGCGSTRPPA